MPHSNDHKDRDNYYVLTGADAEKELSPRGRETLERSKRGQVDDPRKTLRETASQLSARAFREGVSIPQPVRLQLWECGLEDQDIDTWDCLRLLKRRGVPFKPEQKRDYERILPLVERCLKCRCDDGGDPPEDDDGPDFDRTADDPIADARAKKDVEAEPAPVVHQPEPASVPPVTPKAEQKRKPRSRKPARNDGWGRD